MTMDDAMLTEVDLHDEFVLHHGEPIAERHRVDDPNVWGLVDVTRGRTPSSPTTIYKRAGDSASGVVGRLTPDGKFHPIHSTRIGNEFTCGLLHDVRPVASEPTKVLVTGWDGAAPMPEFLGEAHGGGTEVRQEHTRGALLGDYQIRRDVDRGSAKTQAVARGPRNKRGTLTFKAGGVAPQGQLIVPDHGPCGYDEAA